MLNLIRKYLYQKELEREIYFTLAYLGAENEMDEVYSHFFEYANAEEIYHEIRDLSKLYNLMCRAMNYPKKFNGFERYVHVLSQYVSTLQNNMDAYNYIYCRRKVGPDLKPEPFDRKISQQVDELYNARTVIKPYIRELKKRYGAYAENL